MNRRINPAHLSHLIRRLLRLPAAVALVVSTGLAVAATACTPPASLATPPGFVSIDDDAYDHRATNADGVVIAVRTMANDPEGDLAFWAGAIDRKLRQRYQAVDIVEVEAESGARGVQIRYEADHGGRLHRYWATVFVLRGRVFLVEAGGDAEFFDPQLQQVERAVLSVDLS